MGVLQVLVLDFGVSFLGFGIVPGGGLRAQVVV